MDDCNICSESIFQPNGTNQGDINFSTKNINLSQYCRYSIRGLLILGCFDQIYFSSNINRESILSLSVYTTYSVHKIQEIGP